MNLKCKIKVKSTPEEDILFTKDKIYNFIPRENKWTKLNGFIGYAKDDENYKRWFSFTFKDTYFVEEGEK